MGEGNGKRLMKITQSKKRKHFLNKSFWDLWETIKRSDICVIGIPERGERVGKKKYLSQ